MFVRSSLVVFGVGVLLSTGVVSTLCLGSSRCHAEDVPSDWSHSFELPEGEVPIYLFNGKDLSGWAGDERYFSVSNGMIRSANSQPVKVSSYLFTEKKFRDYRLLFEVKQTMRKGLSTMHSAVASVGARVKDQGGDFGFEGPILMFCHDWGIWGTDGRGRVFPSGQKGPINDADWERKGDWNKIEILVRGDRMRMVANGRVVVDHTEEAVKLKECALGLQMHSENRPQEFHFRGLVAVENPNATLVSVDGVSE